jgi:hypothetical protein
MEILINLVPLRDYCRQHSWPRLNQWHHWIYSRNPIALKCIKKIGGRYMLDMQALQFYIDQATLEESK